MTKKVGIIAVHLGEMLFAIIKGVKSGEEKYIHKHEHRQVHNGQVYTCTFTAQ